MYTGCMARPTKLTPKTQKKILEGVRIGLTYERAALLAGITGTTFYNWKVRGEKAASGLYFEFVEALKKAESEGEAAAIQIIIDAAEDGTWQAAAWILERRHPERWSRLRKVELSGADGGPIELNLGGAARELLRGRLLQPATGESEGTADRGANG